MLRQISDTEASILLRTLDVGANEPIPASLLAQVSSLKVTATCGCGCPTIWFGPDGRATNGHLIAEAYAPGSEGNITIIVWSIADSVVGLEFVHADDGHLPDPSSVKGYSSS